MVLMSEGICEERDGTMEKFFIVKNEKLVQQVLDCEEMSEKVNEAFKKFAQENGIESKEYIQRTDMFHVCLTENDRKRFSGQLRKDGIFKKNSPMGTAWRRICSENGLETPRKPSWELNDLIRASCRGFSSRLFSIDGVVYGSFKTDAVFKLPEEHFEELKASEFYRIVEDWEAENG